MQRVRVIEGIDLAIASDAPIQHVLAVQLLKCAKRTFEERAPAPDKIIRAGRSIAWAIRIADELGFRADIQPELDEARFAADVAARRYED